MKRIRKDPAEGIPRRKGAPCKLTMDIEPGLDFRLSGHAKLLRMSKRDFVTKLLNQGCGSYKADESLKALAEVSLGESEATA